MNPTSSHQAPEKRALSEASPAAVSGASTGVTQGVTQPVPPRPASAPERAPAARRPAPYLQRRGQVFYFRKRLSRRAARLTERSEFVVSLRTTRVGEARMRAARVLVELQRAETRMSQLDPVDTLEPEQAKRILAEVARRGLGDLLARHDSGDLFARSIHRMHLSGGFGGRGAVVKTCRGLCRPSRAARRPLRFA